MGTLDSGSFTTSTPYHPQQDSGIYENAPWSRNLSLTFASEDLESDYLPLRKNLFGKRKNTSQNIPDNQFSQRHKLILSRSATLSRRDASSNEETPRSRNSRSCTGPDKPMHFAEAVTPKKTPQLFSSNAVPLKELDHNDSGFCGETPERPGSPEPENSRIPFLQVIENFHQRIENSKEESLAYIKRLLDVSGAKNNADLSTAEIKRLYSIYCFQKRGLKPSVADINFCEKHLLINETDEFLASWKEKLECISADFKKPPKIDFLRYLHNMDARTTVSIILSYLPGLDLQNVRCVCQLWWKLVIEDKNANRRRSAYLKERQKVKEEMVRKSLLYPFQRPPNFRILGRIDNIQKEQLQLRKTIKEINFDAFIEVGKSAEKPKPMKCPSCRRLSVQNKKVITKYGCLFCGYEFCSNCLKPYSNWHCCASISLPSNISCPKPCFNGKRYLRRL